MKGYQLYFYFLILFVLFSISFISLKMINTENNLKLFIDTIFKLSIGLFIILFFLNKKNNKVDKNDRVLIILLGFIILLLIDYVKIISLIKKD